MNTVTQINVSGFVENPLLGSCVNPVQCVNTERRLQSPRVYGRLEDIRQVGLTQVMTLTRARAYERRFPSRFQKLHVQVLTGSRRVKIWFPIDREVFYTTERFDGGIGGGRVRPICGGCCTFSGSGNKKAKDRSESIAVAEALPSCPRVMKRKFAPVIRRRDVSPYMRAV